MEHIQNLDQILINCELDGVTIRITKSQWCQKEAIVLGYLYSMDGHTPNEAKVRKLYEWIHYENVH